MRIMDGHLMRIPPNEWSRQMKDSIRANCPYAKKQTEKFRRKINWFLVLNLLSLFSSWIATSNIQLGLRILTSDHAECSHYMTQQVAMKNANDNSSRAVNKLASTWNSDAIIEISDVLSEKKTEWHAITSIAMQSLSLNKQNIAISW